VEITASRVTKGITLQPLLSQNLLTPLHHIWIL
jgi:hypothetical protein